MISAPMHAPKQCAGTFCPFHNPSDHHMKDWPITVRYDRYGLAERLCVHGCGHPDIDSVNWLKNLYDNGNLFRMGILDPPNSEILNDPDYDPYSIFTVHGCCRCCIVATNAVTDDLSAEVEDGHW